MIDTTESLVQLIAKACSENGIKIVTAESCTGGMISSALTDISGSSAYFERGFVTYSDEAKAEILDVSTKSLSRYGAVSEAVAVEMAIGALQASRAHLALSVTGIAGPTGGSDEKPVGLVHFGLAHRRNNLIEKTEFDTSITSMAYHEIFSGDRASIRKQTQERGLHLLLAQLIL